MVELLRYFSTFYFVMNRRKYHGPKDTEMIKIVSLDQLFDVMGSVRLLPNEDEDLLANDPDQTTVEDRCNYDDDANSYVISDLVETVNDLTIYHKNKEILIYVGTLDHETPIVPITIAAEPTTILNGGTRTHNKSTANTNTTSTTESSTADTNFIHTP